MDPKDYVRWLSQRVRLNTSSSFRIKAAPHVLMKNINTDSYRFFYGSNNTLISVPSESASSYFPINTQSDIEKFADAMSPSALIEAGSKDRENSEWSVVRLLGIYFWVLINPGRPVGEPIDIPEHIRNSRYIYSYSRDTNKHVIR